MNDWKVGLSVVCIKDYGPMKVGVQGVIVERQDTFWNISWGISFYKGSKKIIVKSDDMARYVKKIE